MTTMKPQIPPLKADKTSSVYQAPPTTPKAQQVGRRVEYDDRAARNRRIAAAPNEGDTEQKP